MHVLLWGSPTTRFVQSTFLSFKLSLKGKTKSKHDQPRAHKAQEIYPNNKPRIHMSFPRIGFWAKCPFVKNFEHKGRNLKIYYSPITENYLYIKGRSQNLTISCNCNCICCKVTSCSCTCTCCRVTSLNIIVSNQCSFNVPTFCIYIATTM